MSVKQNDRREEDEKPGVLIHFCRWEFEQLLASAPHLSLPVANRIYAARDRIERRERS